MTSRPPIFEARLAQSAGEIEAAQALRYDVFVTELGGDGPLVDHDARLERDRFDAHAEALLLFDRARPQDDQVVGVYRVMDSAAAEAAGDFYSEQEYDLGALKSSGRSLLELGRSCVHRDYRGGPALLHMWQALGRVVADKDADVLFGVASFHGTDMDRLALPLSLLERDYLAPDDLRVRSKSYQDMALAADMDRVAALRAVPPLIKAYLRLGGFVGDGAFVDHAFNTTDVCLILDTNRMSARQRATYGSVR